MGAPVIVTEGTWFSQVIHKYKAGIIVKPGNMNEITQGMIIIYLCPFSSTATTTITTTIT